MRILYHTKPYTWLQFAVNIPGYVRENLHLTVKFFGTAQVDPEIIAKNVYTIEDKISRRPLFIAKWTAWRLAKFDDNKTVLEFYRYPTCLDALHDKFKLILDDHAFYRPHITVDEKFAQDIERNKLRPYDVELTFGELQLWIGSKKE